MHRERHGSRARARKQGSRGELHLLIFDENLFNNNVILKHMDDDFDPVPEIRKDHFEEAMKFARRSGLFLDTECTRKTKMLFILRRVIFLNDTELLRLPHYRIRQTISQSTHHDE